MDPILVRKPTEEEKKEAAAWPNWEKEATQFPWEYVEKETCLIIEGSAKVEGEGGVWARFGAGDWVVFPVGCKCIWTIFKPIRKHYKFG